MKPLALALLITSLVGCAKQQSVQPPATVEQAAQLYSAVKVSMARDEVYRSLGKPQKTSPDGVEEWRTSGGTQVAVLSLRFGSDAKVSKCDFHVDDAGPFKPEAK